MELRYVLKKSELMIEEDNVKDLNTKSEQHEGEYHIVGKFLLVQISYIWPKGPQNKFSYVLISYARATRLRLSAHAWPTAQHGDLSSSL